MYMTWQPIAEPISINWYCNIPGLDGHICYMIHHGRYGSELRLIEKGHVTHVI